MAHRSVQTLIDELDSLLDGERNALIEGQLGQLGQLGQIMLQKEALIGEINALETLENSSLVAVRQKASRNQALLTSAMEGIRAVAARMAELRRVRRGLDTYDPSGRKNRFGTDLHGKVEKRA